MRGVQTLRRLLIGTPLTPCPLSARERGLRENFSARSLGL